MKRKRTMLTGVNDTLANPTKVIINQQSGTTTPFPLQYIIKMALPPFAHFTEPTTYYWQELLPAEKFTEAPWQYGVPARLPDSRILVLPIRTLKDNPSHAVASLLVNQASMKVVDELSIFLANLVRPYDPEVVIGLPTLGLSLAPIVAKNVGLGENHLYY